MLNSFLEIRISDFLFLFLHCYHEKLINVIIRQVGRMFHIYFIFRLTESFTGIAAYIILNLLKNRNFKVALLLTSHSNNAILKGENIWKKPSTN